MIISSQRPLPDKTQQSQQTNAHAFGEIRTQNLSRRATADPHLRLRGHWDRHRCLTQRSTLETAVKLQEETVK